MKQLLLILCTFQLFTGLLFTGSLSASTAVEDPISFLEQINGEVDLHHHLFMNHGMGPLMNGSFFDKDLQTPWSDRFHFHSNAESLNKSSFRIVVAALYVHPLLIGQTKAKRLQSLLAQIEDAKQFVKTYPEWSLVKTPSEAIQALKNNQRLLILSLETAAGILDDEAIFDRLIKKEGVSMVTFMHLTDDHLGGVALIPGSGTMASPLDWLKSWVKKSKDSEGTHLNPKGLTPDGFSLAEKLMQHHVWIDLTHSSEQTVKDLQPLLKKYHQPWLFTHTMGRKVHAGERSLSDTFLTEVKNTQGMIGIIPSYDMIDDASKKDCSKNITLLKTEIERLQKLSSPEQVVWGTDINSPYRGLPCEFQNLNDWGQLKLKLNLKPNSQVKSFIERWQKVF